MTLAVSNDNGATWFVTMNIEKGTKGDEFSYPSIIHFGDSVAVTYTWKRQRIAFGWGKSIEVVFHNNR